MIHVWYVKKGSGNENKKDGRESGGKTVGSRLRCGVPKPRRKATS